MFAVYSSALVHPTVSEQAVQPRPVVKPKPVVQAPEPTKQPDPPQVAPAGQYDSVNDYFAAGNPKPISHRLGLWNYERNVSNATKKKVKARDGNRCLVCGSTYRLEVDHRIALMNGGDNSIENLGTLCDPCHVKKTRLDYKVRTQRKKRVQ